MRPIFTLTIALSLTSCTTTTWWDHPPGGTQEQFDRVGYECMKQAQQQTSSAYVGAYGGSALSETTTNVGLFKACMRANGYRETKRPSAAQPSSQNTNPNQPIKSTTGRSTYTNAPIQDKGLEDMEKAMERIRSN